MPTSPRRPRHVELHDIPLYDTESLAVPTLNSGTQTTTSLASTKTLGDRLCPLLLCSVFGSGIAYTCYLVIPPIYYWVKWNL